MYSTELFRFEMSILIVKEPAAMSDVTRDTYSKSCESLNESKEILLFEYSNNILSVKEGSLEIGTICFDRVFSENLLESLRNFFTDLADNYSILESFDTNFCIAVALRFIRVDVKENEELHIQERSYLDEEVTVYEGGDCVIRFFNNTKSVLFSLTSLNNKDEDEIAAYENVLERVLS